MKYLRINFNRKLRNISWKIRPVFLLINENNLMYFITACCTFGCLGVIS